MSENENLLTDEELEKDPEGEEIDWEAEARKARATAKRYHSSHKQLQELKRAQTGNPPVPVKQAPAQPAPKEEFGYDELAFLGYKGVQEQDQEYLLGELNSTGKTLKQILDFRYIKDELTSRVEDRKTLEALPTGTARSGSLGKDNVEYWLARGELPPREQVALRRQVVAAKIKREEQNSIFSPNPIV